AALAERSFDRPPALVCNAHITGLGVARALATHEIPVIAIDRNDLGVAPWSSAVELAGRVTYPLDDEAGFRTDLERIAETLTDEPVVFACMDEWVHAVSRTEPAGVRRPFADRATIDAVLDKDNLYRQADRLDIPYPETYRLWEHDPDTVAERLGFPLVLKPALKRKFEAAFGTNVIEVGSAEEYHEIRTQAQEADIRVMAQEQVPIEPGADRSLASYIPPAGIDQTWSIVGRTAARHPAGYGTGCVVTTDSAPTVEDQALRLLEATEYYGISEAEFVYDRQRETYVLLDVNTRPWKWIRLPVAAGINLPYAAYAEAIDEPVSPPTQERTAKWLSVSDYLKRCARSGLGDHLTDDEWRAIISGRFETDPGMATAIYTPSDPGPTHQLLTTEFGEQEYYCAC
ncbi:MAG: carboxylate--amine ligase, partial [Halobacteriales archaeon]|nr:carboxylate--amine ligase [Halobacteriales archaeon]